MDAQELLNFIHHPEQLDDTTLDALEQAANAFPFCQTTHLLLAKNHHNIKHPNYHEKLRRASAHSIDRKRIFQLINNTFELPPIVERKSAETPNPVVTTVADEPLKPLSPLFETPANTIVTTEPSYAAEEPVKTIANIGFSSAHKSSKLSPAEILAQRLNELSSKKQPKPEIAVDKPIVEAPIIEPPILHVEQEAAPISLPQEPVNEPSTTNECNASPVEHLFTKVVPDEVSIVSATGSNVVIPPIEEPEQFDILAEIAHIEDTLPPFTARQNTDANHSSASIVGKKTFSEWLKLSRQGVLKHTHSDNESLSDKDDKKSLQQSIIDAFIKEEPRIVPGKAGFYPTINLAIHSEDDEGIASETLAKLYVKQGNISKAIYTYEKLSLMFPEKIALFAAQIESLKLILS